MLTAERAVNEPNLPNIAYFISFGACAELTQRFFTDWTAAIRGAYVQDLYSIRTDRTDLGGIGLRYQSRQWLEFGLDINMRARHSNISESNYTEHSSMVMMNVSL
jgi:hypothetical protein